MTDVPHDAWPQVPGSDERPDEAYSGTPAAHTWTALFVLAILFLAYDSTLQAISGIQAAFDPDGAQAQALAEVAQGIDANLLWINSAIILVAFGFIPMAWVALTRVRLQGTWRYLRMEGPGIGRQLAIGSGIGVLLWLAVIVLSVIQLAVTGQLDDLTGNNTTEQSPVAEALVNNINWPLALFIAAVAGFAEEVFFRGVLQRWIGWWGQAIVFGLTHAGYGTVAQIVVPFALGLLFGWMVKRGRGLWVVIAAHFMYDFVQLALALLVGTG